MKTSKGKWSIVTSQLSMVVGLFTFFSFILFSYLVHEDQFTRLDFDTTVRLQDNLPRTIDAPFSALSLIGSFETASIILLLLLVIIRKMSYFYVLASFVLFHVIELFGKFYVNHPGPPFMFFRYSYDLSFPSSYIQPGFSYPSGHAGRTAFFAAVFIVLIWKTKLNVYLKMSLSFALLAFAFVMFVSRVYLGEHWSTDVIGGVLLGTSLGLLATGIESVGFFRKLRSLWVKLK